MCCSQTAYRCTQRLVYVFTVFFVFFLIFRYFSLSGCLETSAPGFEVKPLVLLFSFSFGFCFLRLLSYLQLNGLFMAAGDCSYRLVKIYCLLDSGVLFILTIKL